MSSFQESTEWEDTAFDMASLSFISDLDQSKLKRVIVSNALQNNDLSSLQQLGITRFGFVNSDLRSKSWLRLLESRVKGTFQYGPANVPHKDEYQVKLDVNRAFSFIKDDEKKQDLRSALYDAIVCVLRKFPALNYYQGYHEVISVFVLVCAKESLDKTVELFTLLYLRDFMMDSLQCTLENLDVLSQFMYERDSELANILQLNQRRPIFAIASVLTLLVHNFELVDQDSPLLSVFDIIISTNNLSNIFVIYSELLICFKGPILRQIEVYLVDFDNDMDMIHSVIQQTLLKLLTVSVWDNILMEARVHLNNKTVKMTKYVNQYSSLITSPIVESSELLEILEKEIEWNNSRSKATTPTIPPIVKWSLVIGIIAAVIKVGTSHSNIHNTAWIESVKKIIHG